MINSKALRVLGVVFFLFLGSILPYKTFSAPELIQDFDNNLDFKVIDSTTDRATRSDGKTVERLYLTPRALYIDEKGEKKVRRDDWLKFDSDSRSKLNAKIDIGYKFSMPFVDGGEVEILAGDLEKKKDGRVIKKDNPQKINFAQERKKQNEVERLTTSYENVYENIDVNFIDKRDRRTKEIFINEKPDIKDDENLVFWEIYKVPKDAKIYIGENEYKGQIITTEIVRVKNGNGTLFISPSVVFDSRYDDPSYRDIVSKEIEQEVVFDMRKSELKIGLIVDGKYLNDLQRVYPVIGDSAVLIVVENLPLELQLIDVIEVVE